MTMTLRFIRYFVFAAFILTTPAALAVTPECARFDMPSIVNSVAPGNRLNALEQNGCLGGDLDDNALTRTVTATLATAGSPQASGVSDEERRQATAQALEQVAQSTATQRAAISGEDRFSVRERLQRLESALGEARSAVASGRSGEGLQRPAYWQYDRDKGSLNKPVDVTLRIDITLFAGFIDTACPALPPGPDCQQVYTAAQDILRYVRLVERSLTYYSRPIIDAHYADARRRDRQWDAYFDEALFQYPWELALNGAWLKKHDPRPEDAHGNKLGFLPPPTSQWIVLHPNVGMEYVAAAPDGQQFKPVVYIEMLGYNRWRWGESGDMKNALGWSVLASYADRAATKDLRYGVMVHYRNSFDLGITYSDKDVGVILSMDLAQAVSRVSDTARKVLRFGRD